MLKKIKDTEYEYTVMDVPEMMVSIMGVLTNTKQKHADINNLIYEYMLVERLIVNHVLDEVEVFDILTVRVKGKYSMIISVLKQKDGTILHSSELI